MLSFCHQHTQIHEDYANQTGSSEFIWTKEDGCFLTLRARLSVFEFIVRGIWMSSKV